MNDIAELVDLPDPAGQPLVHPLDLPQARRLFRASWLITALTSTPVGLCAAAIVWFASRNYIVPLIAGAAIIGFGQLASRCYRDQAWAFIPRKRQDRQRPLPATWELMSGLVFAAVLATALLLVAFRLGRPGIAVEGREVAFGMSAAASLLIVVVFIGKLVRQRSDERRRTLFTLPAVIAVVASVAVSYDVLLDSSGARPWATVWWGAAAMLVVGTGTGVWKYTQHRRATVICR